MIILHSPYLILNPTYDRAKAAKIFISCIEIKTKDFTILTKYSNYTVWATYVYAMNQDLKNVIFFAFSGNYTLDYEFFAKINDFNKKYPSISFKLNLEATYLESYDRLITDLKSECIQYNNNNYCMTTESGVLGSQKLINTLEICQYFILNPNLENFISTLMNLYQNCEFDYSLDCLHSYISSSPNENPQISKSNTNRGAPYYVINYSGFRWPDYFIEGFLLSIWDPGFEINICGESCTLSDIRDNVCDSVCNSTECGFDNLKCIYTGNCLNFLIGDGNCDNWCTAETDCLDCPIECSEANIKSGVCPSSCVGECFHYCNQSLWCSAGCSWSDLSVGKCSESCSDNCLGYCKKECSAGCSYEELYKGNCPYQCSYTCFGLCDQREFCSPGCRYKDCVDGKCSDICTVKCKDNCAATKCGKECFYSNWINGFCNKHSCSDVCYDECSKIACAPLCTYSSMRSGNCPQSCYGNCFGFCNQSVYCSPGCKYSDLNLNPIPLSCSQKCICYAKCGESDECVGNCTGKCCKSGSANSNFSTIFLIVFFAVVIGGG